MDHSIKLKPEKPRLRRVDCHTWACGDSDAPTAEMAYGRWRFQHFINSGLGNRKKVENNPAPCYA